jgi:hypothetical protein
MKYIVLILVLISCNNCAKDIRSFENYLGVEQTKSLSLAIKAWDDFVNRNRGNNSVKEFSLIFLQEHLRQDSVYVQWNYDCNLFRQVIKEISNSGLEKSFWIYNNEEYDDLSVLQYYTSVVNESNQNELIDTIEIVNEFQEYSGIPEVESTQKGYEVESKIFKMKSSNSKIISGLHQFCTDTFIKGSAEIIIKNGPLSPSIIINGIVTNQAKVNFTKYFTKIFIIQTVFYDFMYEYSNRKC